jgi:aminobenzoyl-glutamate utilization protein B
MREHVPQETRIHYVITQGGEAPNVVPEVAEVYYYVRHPDQKVVAELMERVRKAAEGAALGTGTSVEFNQVGGTFDLLPNDALGHVMYESFRSVPLPHLHRPGTGVHRPNSANPPSGTQHERERNRSVHNRYAHSRFDRRRRCQLYHADCWSDDRHLGSRHSGT